MNQQKLRRRGFRALSTGSLALLALLSCAPEAPRLAPGEAARSYFPLVPGARWVYEIDLGPGTIKLEVRARGERSIAGLPAPVFVMDETNLGESFGMAQTAPTAYLVDSGYLSRLTAIDYDRDGSLRRIGREDPSWLLPVAPTPGSEWTQDAGLFRLPEGGGGRLRWTGKVLSIGPAEVPAGRFDDVVVVRVEYWDPSVSKTGPVIEYEDAYARGVGLIRSESRNAIEGGPAPLSRQVLLRYEFPELVPAPDVDESPG